MTPFEWIIAITSLVGLIGGGISLYESDKQAKKQADLAQSSLDLNKSTSEQNFNLQKEQFNYQQELNETIMQREDSAMQRQVADLKAAGLSPLMVSGGASATPLNSATAPQRDISGINQAIGNLMGAYNDIFNRKMNRHQFMLNTVAQSAQLYTQIAESKLNQKKIKLENDILDLDYKYYKNHPERNLGLTQVLTNLASGILQKNGSAIDLLSGSIPSNNPVATGEKVPGSNRAASNIIDFLNNPKEITGNLNIPTLSKKKNVINDSDLKKILIFSRQNKIKIINLLLTLLKLVLIKKTKSCLKLLIFFGIIQLLMIIFLIRKVLRIRYLLIHHTVKISLKILN